MRRASHSTAATSPRSSSILERAALRSSRTSSPSLPALELAQVRADSARVAVEALFGEAQHKREARQLLPELIVQFTGDSRALVLAHPFDVREQRAQLRRALSHVRL